jgi:hypothetical protein
LSTIFRRAAIALVSLMLLAGSCRESGSSGPSPSPSPRTKRPSSTATIKIVDPQPGQTISGTTYIVKIDVTGATVLQEASTDVRPDTGHVHLALDGETVTLLAGLEYELHDLTPGDHLVQAEFAAADHGPFNPRVLATVTFKVQ